MTEEDTKFIETRLKTLEAQKFTGQLKAYTIKDIKQAITYLPHLARIHFAKGIAGPEKYKLLLP